MPAIQAKLDDIDPVDATDPADDIEQLGAKVAALRARAQRVALAPRVEAEAAQLIPALVQRLEELGHIDLAPLSRRENHIADAPDMVIEEVEEVDRAVLALLAAVEPEATTAWLQRVLRAQHRAVARVALTEAEIQAEGDRLTAEADALDAAAGEAWWRAFEAGRVLPLPPAVSGRAILGLVRADHG
jgi:hypothetical protein